MGGNDIDEAEVLTVVLPDTLVKVSALLLAFTVTRVALLLRVGRGGNHGGASAAP